MEKEEHEVQLIGVCLQTGIAPRWLEGELQIQNKRDPKPQTWNSWLQFYYLWEFIRCNIVFVECCVN